MNFIKNYLLWLIFVILMSYMIIREFLLYRNNSSSFSIKEALKWTLIWMFLSISFNLIIWVYLNYYENQEIANYKSLSFLTSILVEKVLSIDNIFVWIAVFDFFSIPIRSQNFILFYCTVTTIVLRVIFIFSGIYLLSKFQFLFYVFGVFLLFTSIKMLFFSFQEKKNINRKLLNWLYKYLRVINLIKEDSFLVKKSNTVFATPLLIALIMIELSNIVFSFDSIMAIISITNDLLIIITSNLFALSGLRYMYFILLKIIKKCLFLKYGFAIILLFSSLKMLVKDIIYISVYFSLIFIIIIIAISLLLNYFLLNKKIHKSNLK